VSAGFWLKQNSSLKATSRLKKETDQRISGYSSGAESKKQETFQVSGESSTREQTNMSSLQAPPGPPPRDKETTWEKVQRKFGAEPLIPLGAIATVGFLTAGLRAFHSNQPHKSQMLMRGRIVAQGFTVFVMCIGGYMGMKPHSRPVTYEEKLGRQHTQDATEATAAATASIPPPPAAAAARS